MSNIKITVLGCGTSAGVPSLEDGWGTVDSTNPKNKRRRCAITMQTEDAHILVDCGPDIKEQLFDYSQNNNLDFDGLFITHQHADHIHGIDEIRWINKKNNKDVKTYSTKAVFDNIIPRFEYAFTPLPEGTNFYFKPVLQAVEIKEEIKINNSVFTVIKQDHGFIESSGYRYGDFAYCTDVVDFDPSEFEKLKGVKTLIVDCLREKPHQTHAHLEKVLSWVNELNPDMTYLTHMDNTMDYDRLCDKLPANVRPAYDGLEITAS
ncbi:MAG: MBL fold metallo-hydrolase [Alphaproteobacteria bacterium]